MNCKVILRHTAADNVFAVVVRIPDDAPFQRTGFRKRKAGDGDRHIFALGIFKFWGTYSEGETIGAEIDHLSGKGSIGFFQCDIAGM